MDSDLAQGEDGDISSGKRCQSIQEEGLGVEPQGGGQLPQERRAGFRTQRSGFNPRSATLASRVTSTAWLTSLTLVSFSCIMIGGQIKSNNICFHPALQIGGANKCPCVSFNGSCLGWKLILEIEGGLSQKVSVWGQGWRG